MYCVLHVRALSECVRPGVCLCVGTSKQECPECRQTLLPRGGAGIDEISESLSV